MNSHYSLRASIYARLRFNINSYILEQREKPGELTLFIKRSNMRVCVSILILTNAKTAKEYAYDGYYALQYMRCCVLKLAHISKNKERN